VQHGRLRASAIGVEPIKLVEQVERVLAEDSSYEGVRTQLAELTRE
jgi:hypothetical protein